MSGTDVGSTTGNGRSGNDGEVSVDSLLPPACGSGQVSFLVSRAWRSLINVVHIIIVSIDNLPRHPPSR